MVPRQFYYPRVVIKFYHTMTSRREANLIALHLPVVISNVAGYRQWPHPSTMEMVRLLSMDATDGSILFRRHLPQCMLLIDYVLRSDMFPLQHIVQRR